MLAVALLLVPISRAAAQGDTQDENRFAIGAEFKVKTSDRAAGEDYARGQLRPGLLWRFGQYQFILKVGVVYSIF